MKQLGSLLLGLALLLGVSSVAMADLGLDASGNERFDFSYDESSAVAAAVKTAHASVEGWDAFAADETTGRALGLAGHSYDSSTSFVAPNTAGGTTRVGRWMSPDELAEMSSTGRVVEGGGGRTFVVEPPNPAAYPSALPGSVYAEFDVPTDVLSTANKPEWAVTPGPNVTTRIYGPPPLEMPPATCIVCVTGN